MLFWYVTVCCVNVGTYSTHGITWMWKSASTPHGNPPESASSAIMANLCVVRVMLEYGNLQEDIKILPEPTNSDKYPFLEELRNSHLPKGKK